MFRRCSLAGRVVEAEVGSSGDILSLPELAESIVKPLPGQAVVQMNYLNDIEAGRYLGDDDR